jgi:hypothetical protein
MPSYSGSKSNKPSKKSAEMILFSEALVDFNELYGTTLEPRRWYSSLYRSEEPGNFTERHHHIGYLGGR